MAIPSRELVRKGSNSLAQLCIARGLFDAATEIIYSDVEDFAYGAKTSLSALPRVAEINRWLERSPLSIMDEPNIFHLMVAVNPGGGKGLSAVGWTPAESAAADARLSSILRGRQRNLNDSILRRGEVPTIYSNADRVLARIKASNSL
ncbi:hypothetical protein SAPIO_CDS0434 [Scedosporium apiospermum]|uniref:Uncharacterized protein n=1 Tax=Pseudallescheria apiosperma TaxID=563466 RepID=A0A084GH00_PSEDA|nr:uncharacterized protein SAPIO_CDS0434 [Scedosporium apiospermum]KEZ46612.1 hypothetical protein SAPIO_CDS0434 [Scedosporium apiospermum]